MGLGVPPIIIALVSFIIFIALLVWFIYLVIRLIFAYYILLYSDEVMKSKFYIDESFRLTKKKVWKIISFILPFLILLGITVSIIQTGEEILSKNRIYNTLLEIQSKSGQDDHKLLEGFFSGNDDDRTTFGDIEKVFPSMKIGINKDFLSASMSYIDTKAINPDEWFFSIIFVLLSFLLFEGLTSMLYLSTYKVVIEGHEKK
jgi:hypothetical protein